MRILVAAAITLAGLLTLSVAAQQPAPADDLRFTGISTVLDGKDLSAARRRFEPGARSAWHSHDNGQLLFVENGRGRTQKRGMAMRELGPGDSDYTGPNVIHWHGAAAGQEFIQINVGFGGETKWMEKTTDDEYAGRIRK